MTWLPPTDGSGSPPVSAIAAVVDRLIGPVAVVDSDGLLRYVNPAGAHLLGVEPSWLVGRNMLALVHPDDRERVARQLDQITAGRPSAGISSYRLRTDPDHEWRVVESMATNLMDEPSIGGIVVSSRDVTLATDQASELQRAAHSDALTGLANRTGLVAALRALDGGSPRVVAHIALDDLTAVNASLGHAAGDTVLRVTADRIRSVAGPAAIIARLGGESFVCVLPSGEVAEARSIGWQLIDTIAEPVRANGSEVRTTASIGLSQATLDISSESALTEATLALQHARGRGGARVETFDRSLRDATVNRRRLEADLRCAVDRSELGLALQPIVRFGDAEVIGSEALMRWHRGGEPTPPSEFIAVAEMSPLILRLGEWVFDRVTTLDLPSGHDLHLNLSARQLASPNLHRSIARMIRLSDRRPEDFSFEVTETLLIERFDVATHALRSIRELGCRIGLDDFGCGYSSVGYLRNLPIDFLKVDGRLTANVLTDDRDRAILRAIADMTAALDLVAIAEGVETEDQAAALREAGFGVGQGFLYGSPVEQGAPEPA